MKSKKVLAIICVASIVGASLTACTSKPADVSTEASADSQIVASSENASQPASVQDSTAADSTSGTDTTSSTAAGGTTASGATAAGSSTTQNTTVTTKRSIFPWRNKTTVASSSTPASQGNTSQQGANTQPGTTQAPVNKPSSATPTRPSNATPSKPAGSTQTKPTGSTQAKPTGGTQTKPTGNTSPTQAPKPTNAPSQTTPTQAPKPEPIKIELQKNGTAACKSDNVTIQPASANSGYQGIVYIEKGGDYLITSSTKVWHGQIFIKLKNTEKADIRIENVNIETSKANAIRILDMNILAERTFIEADVSSSAASDIDTDSALRDEMKEVAKNDKAPNVDLSFPTGTSSSFTTNANSLSGVIYNESKLTIKGNGNVSISATQNRNNAICSTKSVTFKNVTAKLSTAANNVSDALGSARGIFSFSTVRVESGVLNIASNGDCIRCDDYKSDGGQTTLSSSAADAIDADDAIVINSGSVSATALKKSSFKVRRINNQERINAGDKTVAAKDGVVDATKHTFKINGGTVRGESKNITTVQKASTQASIVCKSVKKKDGVTQPDMSKTPVVFTISGVNAKSSNACIKFLYSSGSVKSDASYKVSAVSGNKKFDTENVKFSGKVGTATIYTAQEKSGK